jgi:hypothetical protein
MVCSKALMIDSTATTIPTITLFHVAAGTEL